MVSLSFNTPILHFDGFHLPSEGVLAAAEAPAPKRRRHFGTSGFSAMMASRLACCSFRGRCESQLHLEKFKGREP